MAAIKATLGFDPENDDLEQRPKPADDLNNCYMIGEKKYTKPGQDTVDVLDFALIYMQFPEKFKYVKKLMSSIETFLA